MPSAISNGSAPKFVPPVQDRAELRTIKFTSLLDQDQDAISALVAASKEVGFFYLDLTDDASQQLLENLGDLKDVMADWFAQPDAIKRKAPTVTKAHGYKPIGTHAGVGGQRDGWEALKVSPCAHMPLKKSPNRSPRSGAPKSKPAGPSPMSSRRTLTNLTTS